MIDDWLIDDWLIDDWLIDDWLIVARTGKPMRATIIIAFVFCRRCAPWLGVSPVRLVGGCRIIRWLPPVIPAVGSPAIP
ncbi:hypothetical protein [Bifidobacterium longum]|uniref:hypothetical protein n=1 Tax=Bifidobacterium longum TaxID=216816 RepID=UPI00398CA2A4